MAEEPGRLSRISDDDESPDAVSTAAGATDTYSTGKLGDYPTSDTETRALEANTTDDADATGDEATDDTEQIRAQIEETRSHMSETIDAIQERLSMSNIKEQVSDQINSAVETAKDAVYVATVGKAEEFMQNIGKSLSNVTGNVGNSLAGSGSSIVGTVRSNPLPFALIGLGVGLLALQSRRSSSKSSPSYRYDYDAGNYTEGEYDASGGRRGGRSTLKSAGKSVGNVANTAYSGVSGAASSAYQGLTSVAGTAYEGVGTVGTQAKQVAGKAQDQYEYYIEENPLAVGAVALALGAAVGFMIPATQTESQLMGEYRDNLMQKAGDAARGALDKVQQVAGDMANSVREEAQNQGLVQ